MFQWPGGVSEEGPSAQNSASTRVKSPRGTMFGGYAAPVTGFSGCPAPSLVPRLLLPNAPGEMSIISPSSASSHAVSRMTSTTQSFISGSSTEGTTSTSSRTPRSSASGSANGSTYPQFGPM